MNEPTKFEIAIGDAIEVLVAEQVSGKDLKRKIAADIRVQTIRIASLLRKKLQPFTLPSRNGNPGIDLTAETKSIRVLFAGRPAVVIDEYTLDAAALQNFRTFLPQFLEEYSNQFGVSAQIKEFVKLKSCLETLEKAIVTQQDLPQPKDLKDLKDDFEQEEAIKALKKLEEEQKQFEKLGKQAPQWRVPFHPLGTSSSAATPVPPGQLPTPIPLPLPYTLPDQDFDPDKVWKKVARKFEG